MTETKRHSDGFNRQGRSISESMRLRDFKKFLSTAPKISLPETVLYCGFEITGRKSKWFLSNSDPRIFKSLKEAKDAVDTCLGLRALLTEGRS